MYENPQLISLLKDRKLKVTSTRLTVLSIIYEYPKAIPYSKLQKALHNFDRVTLYRTLNALTENGIIHKAMVDENENFYALCSSNCTSEIHNHKHVHFKCKHCKEVSCVQSDNAIDFSIPGYFVENFEIEATGICKGCNVSFSQSIKKRL